MNAKISLLISFLLLTFASVAQKKMITLEDIYEKGTFSSRGIPDFNFMANGIHFTRQAGSTIIKYDLKSGEIMDTIFDAKAIMNIPFDGNLQSYVFSKDEKKLLLSSNAESIYRYSFVADYYVYDIPSKKLQRIHANAKIKYPEFSPDGTLVAFVFENNLYYQILSSGKTIQITKDGKHNFIINGASDWVYEEEFTLTRAYEWSPNGDQIAFIRFDESHVKEFTLEYFRDGVYPEKYSFKYPKVGEQNSILTVWNYTLKNKKLKHLDIGLREDDYIPRIKWTLNNNELCVSWMNRDQNILKLILCNAKNNTYRVLLQETNDYYIDLQDHLQFLDGDRFIWASEKDGHNHLYLYGMNGQLIRQLTHGKEELTNYYGLDHTGTYMLCQFSEKDGLERKLYKVKLSDGLKLALPGQKAYQNAQVSPGHHFMIISRSDISTPTSYVLTDNEANVIRELESNEKIKNSLQNFDLSGIELFKIPNAEGLMLNAAMIKPKDFSPVKKYPVFMFLYGGPGSQQVMNRWNAISNTWWLHMLTQKGYIVCVVDNRGTGGRGEHFKKMTYLQLGKYETEDQIDAAKYLAALPYVDGNRIGIFGWSYGGYMSSLCLFKGNDVFKAAIAVAPVTNWKWYDSIYTERYMRRLKDNKKGYEENSPVNFADRLKGNYLLVHGMADDNVHFQNTAEMANALIKHNKQFDTYFYPNRNHGIGGQNARMHLFTKMTNFVLEKL